MEIIWNFFEDLDEMVYVAEIETHAMVYMNRHLRQSLGFHSHGEYADRPCYKVLQGSDSPCAFCTNGALEEGSFLSWTHENPVLGKRFLIKDTMVRHNGRRYRIEIAIDIDSEVVCKTPYYYARSETILNECMQRIFSTTDPEQSIKNMLEYIGETFRCDRSYLFELYNGDRMSNTYEWCAEGVVPQRELLQEEHLDSVSWWMKEFEKDNVVIIHDLEDIRDKYPSCYALLKPQDITTLAVGPITSEGRVIGFLGVDNPTSQMLTLVAPLLNVIGYFASSLLRRRDLNRCLNELSYHDQLTGAFNRNALAKYYGELSVNSMGVLYCDITGLKQVNDTLGHKSGDRMICMSYDLLREELGTDLIYRTGGDEFIILCPDWEQETFYQKANQLRCRVRQNEYHIAVGYAWSENKPLKLEELIVQADQMMYQNKRDYYRKGFRKKRLGPSMELQKEGESVETCPTWFESPFKQFLSSAYYDPEAMFLSIAQDNSSSYFYFGDMQKDLYFISDNMRDDFGFESNIVSGLLSQWAQRISTPEFRERFWQDISGMLEEKRSIHDMRYQVRDVSGNNQWIHCYGRLQWDEGKTRPLFFSGRVNHQDNAFVIDPITNLPREHTAFDHLRELQKNGESTLVLGFSFNSIAEINSTKGRAYADHMLKWIADALMEKLSWKMSFYRLEGMRCMAILDPAYREEPKGNHVEQIQTLVRECYEDMGIPVQNICSFAFMEYPCGEFTPEDLVANLIPLIRLAKQDVKQPYVDYTPQNIQRLKEMSKMALTLSQDVTNGMEHFRIMIQPVVSAGDGAILGGEILLRWSFEGKDVSPADFIPILEKSNLIQQVGRWVFEQAVCACVRIHAYDPTFYLTFNVSLYQLSDVGFPEFMRQTLEKYYLDGSNLVVELTESYLDEQPEMLSHFINACDRMGMFIALDDFGSGYSSMRMLLQYPFSIIKLDQSLVNEITESGEKLNFIRSIVYACHQFGKAVCIEGVERADQNSIIRDTGCDMIQGYFYYRPTEIHDIYNLVSRRCALTLEDRRDQ